MKTVSAADLKRMRETGELFHDPKAPAGPPPGEELGPDFWAKAMRHPPKIGAKSVHLKLDPDVFEFFKRQGKGHLTKMQEVLRAYVQAHRQT